MYSDGSALTQLPRAECLKLMASVPMGRVIYTRQALPAVELVNFAFADGDIVLRTDPGGQLAVAARGAVVAFEVDCAGPGPAGRLERDRHRALTCGDRSRGGRPAEDDRPRPRGRPARPTHFIRISPEILTGRYLRANGHKYPARQPAGAFT